MLLRSFCVIGLLVAFSAPAVASDFEDVSEDDKVAAREMYARGDDAFRLGQFDEALKAFVGADTIMRVPTTGLEVGRCLTALGRLIEARRYLTRVATTQADEYEPEPFSNARREARKLLRDLKERIPRVTIALSGVNGDDAQVQIDGSLVRPSQLEAPIMVDPGGHQLDVRAVGFESTTLNFTLRAAEVRKLEVTMTPSRSSDGSGEAYAGDEGSPWWPYASLGVGGAWLIVGAVTGGLSLSAASDFQELCDEGSRRCPPEAEDDHDRAETLAHVSTASLVIGGVGVAVGVVGLVLNTTGDDSEATALVPEVGPGYLGLRGQF